MHVTRESKFEALLADAQQDPEVLAVFLFGSRSRDGFADERSDYDVGVVVSDREGALAAFDERWPYVHGARVEVVSSTLSELREHGEFGGTSEWARYQYAYVTLLIDKTGEAETILRTKQRLPEDVRAGVIEQALGGYINSMHRSLRNRMVGVLLAAQLDAAESLPYVLTAIFAFESRVRPFNKYLEWELRTHPLAERAWAPDVLLPRLDAVLAGHAEDQHVLFREVDRVARGHGFAGAIDEWQPDLAWLRGEATYRA
ncbi:MAG: nucleotidyltransferase domain-containing protein [Gaiellaceae bacterium]